MRIDGRKSRAVSILVTRRTYTRIWVQRVEFHQCASFVRKRACCRGTARKDSLRRVVSPRAGEREHTCFSIARVRAHPIALPEPCATGKIVSTIVPDDFVACLRQISPQNLATKPAKIRLALRALHVIAAAIFFDQHLALWTRRQRQTHQGVPLLLPTFALILTAPPSRVRVGVMEAILGLASRASERVGEPAWSIGVRLGAVRTLAELLVALHLMKPRVLRDEVGIATDSLKRSRVELASAAWIHWWWEWLCQLTNLASHLRALLVDWPPRVEVCAAVASPAIPTTILERRVQKWTAQADDLSIADLALAVSEDAFGAETVVAARYGHVLLMRWLIACADGTVEGLDDGDDRANHVVGQPGIVGRSTAESHRQRVNPVAQQGKLRVDQGNDALRRCGFHGHHIDRDGNGDVLGCKQPRPLGTGGALSGRRGRDAPRERWALLLR
mmetsp:Transcript_32492/g.80585  ORF Transcript_32492/g.80585 Transcript_32492/m.80585 type:complete len:445 (+) Transcript_32492:2839-4173(+)